MRFIGITGGVGAGKSAILSFLHDEYDATVILTDDLAKELMVPGTMCNDRLQEAFGQDGVFDAEGNILKQEMAQLIFSDAAKLEQMNAIVHPAVKAEVIRQADELRKSGKCRLLILESALLIEENYDPICDELWYIFTDEDHRRARLKESRGYSDEKVDQIFASQLSEEEFRKACGHVIDNNGSPEESFAQIRSILGSKEDL